MIIYIINGWQHKERSLEKMKEKYKVFKLNGKELCAYTLRGTFAGEEEATKELLAYENNCQATDISVSIEERG